MKTKKVTIDAKTVLTELAAFCKEFKSIVPQWNFNSRNPEADFLSDVEVTLGAWLPNQHVEFIQTVGGKTKKEQLLGELLHQSKEIIFTALGVVTDGGGARIFDPKILEHYPVKPRGTTPDALTTAPGEDLPEDAKAKRKAERAARRAERKARKQSKLEENDDMSDKKTAAKGKTNSKAAPKKDAKKASGEKTKKFSKGSSGQISPIGKKDWKKLPDDTKLLQGEAPRQRSSDLGKLYDMLPTGKTPTTVGSVLNRAKTNLKMKEGKAKSLVYKLVNRYHAKIVR